MTVRVDINKPISESNFEALPEGIYDVRVESVEVKQKDSQAYPQLVMKTEIVHDENEELVGRALWGQQSLSPKAVGFLNAFFKALNVYCAGNEFDEQELVGQTARVYAQQYSKNNGDVGISIRDWYECVNVPCEQKDITVTSDELEPSTVGQTAGPSESLDDDLPF